MRRPLPDHVAWACLPLVPPERMGFDAFESIGNGTPEVIERRPAAARLPDSP